MYECWTPLCFFLSLYQPPEKFSLFTACPSLWNVNSTKVGTLACVRVCVHVRVRVFSCWFPAVPREAPTTGKHSINIYWVSEWVNYWIFLSIRSQGLHSQIWIPFSSICQPSIPSFLWEAATSQPLLRNDIGSFPNPSWKSFFKIHLLTDIWSNLGFFWI